MKIVKIILWTMNKNKEDNKIQETVRECSTHWIVVKYFTHHLVLQEKIVLILDNVFLKTETRALQVLLWWVEVGLLDGETVKQDHTAG